MMNALTQIHLIKGTAWVDKQTGALLKLTLDYQEGVTDPMAANNPVMGSASGHVDFLVTQVGKTTVTLPQSP